MKPKLWWLIKHLPRRWRLDLLEALAWPEFEVKRLWLVADRESPTGVRVDRIDLKDVAAYEAEGLMALQAGVACAHDARTWANR